MLEGAEVIFGVVFFVIFVVASIVAAVAKSNATQRYEEEERRRQSQQTVKKSSTVAKPKTLPKMQSTLDFSIVGEDGHTHAFDTVEEYEDAYGSLGANSDEGCAHLAGLRLIVNDEAYDSDSEETSYDLANIAMSIVLGEVLDKPRFKR